MPEASLQIAIESKVDRIASVNEVVRGHARSMGFSDDEVAGIELAVHEAVVNAVVHGAGGEGAGSIVDVRLWAEAGAWFAEVRDRGAGFDPNDVPSPLAQENLLKPSGRGLLYMRAYMDEVSYSAHPDGGTVVRMRKQKRNA